jgi:hypothetical protein
VPVIEAWWTEAHRIQRIQTQLRELHVPEWIISAALFVYHLRHRRRQRNA